MRVAIYTRVSQKDQSEEIQIDGCRKYAALKGYEIVKEYSDVVTGAVEKRKKETDYDRLLEDAKSGKFEALIVWKFDRFARSLIHFCQSVKHLEECGVKFISVNENIDATTSTGQLILQILAVFAEFERKAIRERCQAGIDRIKQTGLDKNGNRKTLMCQERMSPEHKKKILDLWDSGARLIEICALVPLPKGTINSLIRRTVVPCLHGKYRHRKCGGNAVNRRPVRGNEMGLTAEVGGGRRDSSGGKA